MENNANVTAGIFVTKSDVWTRGGDLKSSYSVYSAIKNEKECELIGDPWDLSNFRPVMTRSEINHIDDFRLFFNSDLTTAYKVWSIDDAESHGEQNNQTVYINEIPLTHPGDSNSVSPEKNVYYYIPYANGQRGKLIFEKQKFPDKSTFLQADYNYVLHTKSEPNGIRLDIADKSIKKITFSSAIENSTLSNDSDWLKLTRSGPDSAVCNKLAKQKDFNSVVDQYTDQNHITYWTSDDSDKHETYCVISVNKAFNASTVWDLYFFNDPKLKELGYIPAVRNFRIRDITALYIGKQTNANWFAVTTRENHSIRRPWNNVSLINMVADLCKTIDYDDSIRTGDLCSRGVN